MCGWETAVARFLAQVLHGAEPFDVRPHCHLYAENQAHNQSGNERWFSALKRSFLASVPAEGARGGLGLLAGL